MTTRTDKKRTTFRTVEGFKAWAFDHDMEMATDHVTGSDLIYKFVENKRGEILVVLFDNIDGRIRDAWLHREHVSHSLGSNTLSTLLRFTKEGNR